MSQYLFVKKFQSTMDDSIDLRIEVCTNQKSVIVEIWDVNE